MKNYTNIDGLVLCVVKGKPDVYSWISEIDALDHLLLTYDELRSSINNLLNGNMLYYKNGRFVRSLKAKFILIGRLLFGDVDWQIKVQHRIKKYTYDESKNTDLKI